MENRFRIHNNWPPRTKFQTDRGALTTDDPPPTCSHISTQQHNEQHLDKPPSCSSTHQKLHLHFHLWPTCPCRALPRDSGPAFFFLMTPLHDSSLEVWDTKKTTFPDSTLGVCHSFLLGDHTPPLILQKTSSCITSRWSLLMCSPWPKNARKLLTPQIGLTLWVREWSDPPIEGLHTFSRRVSRLTNLPSSSVSLSVSSLFLRKHLDWIRAPPYAEICKFQTRERPRIGINGTRGSDSVSVQMETAQPSLGGWLPNPKSSAAKWRGSSRASRKWRARKGDRVRRNWSASAHGVGYCAKEASRCYGARRCAWELQPRHSSLLSRVCWADSTQAEKKNSDNNEEQSQAERRGKLRALETAAVSEAKLQQKISEEKEGDLVNRKSVAALSTMVLKSSSLLGLQSHVRTSGTTWSGKKTLHHPRTNG